MAASLVCIKPIKQGADTSFCCQLQGNGLLIVACGMCSKPVKQGELLARISAQLRVKADATWVQSIVKGVLEDDSEAMNILQTILPEPIISRIQVCNLMVLNNST